MTFKKIAVIGDCHLPYLNKSAFTKVIDKRGVIAQFKPDIIINMGDLFDQFSQKKFPGKMIDPQTEFTEAREMAEEMWYLLQKRGGKKAKCFQLRGNHDARASKRLYEKLPELAPFFDDKTPYTFDGVETIHDPKDELIIDNTLYTHGHKTQLLAHLNDVQFMHNVMIGHLHKFMLHYIRCGALKGVYRWACCAGYMSDPFSDALTYRPMKRYFDWTCGITLVENNEPRFIPLGE